MHRSSYARHDEDGLDYPIGTSYNDSPLRRSTFRGSSVGLDESYPRERGRGSGRRTGWGLPFRCDCPSASPSHIAAEFKRLDLTGEGRLTYLTLKSALELREVHVQDSDVRAWLREADRGSKGYVDFQDYQDIYTGMEDCDSDYRGSSRSRSLQWRDREEKEGEWEESGKEEGEGRQRLLRR